jgi:signal transduction histidine kinase
MRTLRPRQLLARGVGGRVVVLLGLAAFVVCVYVVVVLGGGALFGRTESPSLPLSILATTAVALSLARVQVALETAVLRWGLGKAAPYEVLSQFSGAVTAADPPAGGRQDSQDDASEDLPARMAMLLAQGTGAEWAQVWLNVPSGVTLAATWPPDVAADQTPPSLLFGQVAVTDQGLRALPVRHGVQLLGVLRLQERPGVALTPVEQRLFEGLAAQAGLMLRRAGLRADLDGRKEELLVRSEQLKASRDRLIESQDSERKRLERDLHDGAQQHLVALTVHLRLAHTVLGRSPERARGMLAMQADAADAAIETLSTLSRGIYPEGLANGGLGAALSAAVAGSSIPVTIDTYATGRPPSAVEAALYFCGMEAVQNAAKHSGGSSVSVRLNETASTWRLTVVDDGTGFDLTRARDASGVGLANMRDRLDAVGGTVHLMSGTGTGTGTGTTVVAEVPRNDVPASPTENAAYVPGAVPGAVPCAP